MSPGYSDVADLVAKPRPREPSPFDGLLAQSRDLLHARLEEAIGAMLDKAPEGYMQLMLETYNREERARYEEARAVVMEQRDVIETTFHERFQEDFRRRADRARRIGEPAGAREVSVADLQLVDDDDLEDTIKYNDMASKLRAYCEDELVALDQRVGVLLGDADLDAKDNPFHPQVICDAYKLALREVDTTQSVRRMLAKLFDDHVLDDIRSIYKAVNALLVRNSILPKIRFGAARSQEPAAAGAAVPGAGEASPEAIVAEVAAGGGDLFQVLQRLAGGAVRAGVMSPQAGMASTSATMVPGAGMMAAPAAAFPAGATVVPAAGLASAPAGGFPALTGLSADGAAVSAMGVATVAQAAAPAPAGGFPVLDALGVPAGGATIMGAAPGGTQGTPGGAAPVGGIVYLQGPELIGSLTRIQRGDVGAIGGTALSAPACDPGTTNVLHQLKATSVGTGMADLDRLTLDIVAMLFDQLFDDPKVPDGLKGLIGRLQIPMLKVAIADKHFFSSKTHPARRLFDAMGEIALRLPPDFGAASPLYGALQSTLQELVDRFQDDVEIFGEIRDRVLGLLAEEDRRIEEQTRSESQRVEQMEMLGLARTMAQQEIKTRLDRHRNLPATVRDFLGRQWLKLLLLIHVKEGKEGKAWPSAVMVMDQLIWSVEPKSTAEDRSKLAVLLPRLIRHLAAGMKSAGIAENVREQFFAQLMTCHAQAIGASGRTASELAAALPAQTAVAPDPLAATRATRAAAPGDAAADASPGAAAIEVPVPTHAAETASGSNRPADATPLPPIMVPVAAPAAASAPAPIAVPVAAPIGAPVRAPIAAPINATVAPVPSSPIASPAATPIAAPIGRPMAAPIAAPITSVAVQSGVTDGRASQPVQAVQPLAASPELDSLDFTAPLVVKNPFGAGEVSVENNDLDFTSIAAGARAKREESIRRALDTLGIGSWVEFTAPDGERRAARLIFVSPRKTRYLFAADRAGKEIIQCSSAEIGRQLRLGEAVRLQGPPEDSLFDRVMGGLIGKLRPPERETALAH